MKSNSPFRALLVAMLLFGGLVALTDRPMLEDHSGYNWDTASEGRGPHTFGLSIELAGDIVNFSQDMVMVEDTLSHYTAYALESQHYLSGSWRMEHCCAGLTFPQDGEQVAVSLYQWAGDFAFSEQESRNRFVADLLAAGRIELKDLAFAGESWTGIVEGELPIPGRFGEVVRLDEVMFRVSGV